MALGRSHSEACRSALKPMDRLRRSHLSTAPAAAGQRRCNRVGVAFTGRTVAVDAARADRPADSDVGKAGAEPRITFECVSLLSLRDCRGAAAGCTKCRVLVVVCRRAIADYYYSAVGKPRGFFRQLSAVQWHLWIGLSLPLLALAGQLTWLAPWVNLVAVPWLSLLTIPLAMLGMALFAVFPRWAEWLWLAADVSLRPLWLLLDVWPATWDLFQFADGFFLVGGDYLWARHQRNYTAKGHPSPLVAGVASANAAGGSPRATHTANYRARRG